MRKAEKVIGIVFFVLSGLLFVYFLWALSFCYGYVSEAVAAGQLVVKGSEYDIISFYMSNCAMYMIYSLLLFGLGWMFIRFSSANVKEAHADVIDKLAESKEDEEIDKWFDEIKSSTDKN